MPTASKLLEKSMTAGVGANVFVPYFSDGALKALSFCNLKDATETNLVFIADFTNKDIKQLTATQPYSDWLGSTVKPWKVIETKNEIIIYCLGVRANYLVILKVVFNKSDETATISEYKSYNFTWLDYVQELRAGIVIGDTAFLGELDVGTLHVVDLISGTCVNVDLSANLSYMPKPSWKVVNVILDSTCRQIMFMGENVNNAPFYAFDMNRLSVVSTLVSTGGGSSRALIGGLAVFEDKRIIPLSSGGVNNSDNDMVFYDEHLNNLGTFDLAQIIDYPEVTYGFNLIAKLTDGRYFGIGSFHKNVADRNDEFCRFAWVILGSNFAYDNHGVILETALGEWSLQGVNLSREHGNQTLLPIVDLNNYKAYIWLVKQDTAGNITHYLYEVDFSDLSIDEVNPIAYLVYL
ncbi:MAG: hypothetical protein B6U76_06595 [Desulfurococcales archaeon ex4484_217_2]|nr:MAG: hypothetical protein B6U76_06595 [Desulfurococcales archaeon ex4484_217_2]